MSTPTPLSPDEVRQWISTQVPAGDFQGKRVLLIVPDHTRTAPLPLLFEALHAHLGPAVSQLDVLIALGTHPPMTEEQIDKLLGLSPERRQNEFPNVGLYNHAWDDPTALMTIGTLTKADTERVSNGKLSMDVPVQINARIKDYDTLLVLGPVFPHEVVGFSGGGWLS